MLTGNKPLKRKDTSGEPDFDPKLKPDEVLLQITTIEAKNNPDYKLIHSGFLRKSTRAYKIATMYEIINRNTGEFKHYVLDIHSLQKLKKGWVFTYETKFTLTGEEGEIDALYKFLSLFNDDEQPKNIGTYYNIPESEYEDLTSLKEDNIQDIVQLVLENPESYAELVKVGGKNLLNSLASIASKSQEGINILAELIDTIKFIDGDERIEILNVIRNQNLSKSDLDIISGRKDGLDVFSKNLFEESDWIETDWQKFFENNTWIFGYGLDYKFLRILQREAKVSDVTTGGEEQVIADFLLGDMNFTVLVELKRPDTPIFAKDSNRSGSWRLSEDLMFAISQILEQKAEWQIKSKTVQFDKDRKPIQQKTQDPKTILLIGKTTEFSGTDLDQIIKAETFELFRRNLRNIEILTFDELFERASFIINGN
jgi:hypothetical protein